MPQRASIRRGITFAIAILATSVARAAQASGDEAIDFNADVRPILSRHCFLCHGPDVSTRKAGLRLDERDLATAPRRRGGSPIVPGDAEASLVIARLVSPDEEFRMPPPERPRLSAEEIATLRRWIQGGAAYDAHWAWTPIRDVEPPPVDDPAWGAHPVDRFVRARQGERGLSPAAPADRATLIRRATFDLTGLPPTPEEVEAFLADRSGDAWERVVDRLLASPRFGERWARHWLDLVRYAETYGHEFDYPIRHAWRYRDYVIRALNADVPYDRFVTEHLAGDLLEEPRRHPTERFDESIIGTGFWFLSQGTHGPVDVREDEAERIANQIDVLGKTFLGVTASCARCHDHKFDPVTTKDYYALAGFLQSSRRQDAYLDPRGRIATSVEELKDVLGDAEALAGTLEPDDDDVQLIALYATAAGEAIRMVSAVKRPAEGADGEAPGPDESALKAATNLAAGARLLDREVLARWVAALRSPPPEGHPVRPIALELTGETPAADSAPASARGDTFETFDALDRWFVTGHAFQPDSAGGGGLVARGPAPAFAPPGIVHSGRLGRHLQGTIRSETFEIDCDSILYMVSGRGGRIRLIIDGYLLDEFNALLFEGMTFGVDTGEDVWRVHEQRVGRYRGHRGHIEIIDDGDGSIAVDEIRFKSGAAGETGEDGRDGRDGEPGAAGRLQDACAAAVERRREGALGLGDAALLNWMLDKGLLHLGDRESLDAIRLTALLLQAGRIDETIPAPVRVIAMADGTGEDERVFVRGSSRTLGDVAPRSFIESLAPDQAAIVEGSGRMELARRVLAPDNPLPARVMANRVWQHVFADGIVPTPDDFGGLGRPPADPALLDWLAAWFRGDAGWSLKKLVRLLVTSRAYRMSSAASDPVAADRDPENRLMHRAPVRRLEAEAIRDAVLAVSGRLDDRAYGPPVPVHLTPFMTGRGRPRASGPLDGNGRRSIYIEVRRNFRPAPMTVFDAPVPATTIGRRTQSNVPAQALLMLNDPFVVEQSRGWARRILEIPRLSPSARIDRMYLEALARPPTADEGERMIEFLRLQAGERGVEAWKTDEYAWADLAHVIFNMKEFMFVP